MRQTKEEMKMTRIDKINEIANENGVKVSVRELGGSTFANINGQSFKVQGFASFDAKCKELKNYVAPAPLDLTSRLERIERAALA
jgi:hypothetical protein